MQDDGKDRGNHKGDQKKENNCKDGTANVVADATGSEVSVMTAGHPLDLTMAASFKEATLPLDEKIISTKTFVSENMSQCKFEYLLF